MGFYVVGSSCLYARVPSRFWPSLGPLVGMNQGFSGKAPERVELVLAFTPKPDTTYHHRCRVQLCCVLIQHGPPHLITPALDRTRGFLHNGGV